MKTYDAVIIGGGVIGTAIAYYAAKRGQKVVVLEKDCLAAHASRAAGGMLGAQVEFPEPGPLVELSLYSRAMFRELAAELQQAAGVDIGLNESGMLRTAWTEEEKQTLLTQAIWQRAAGLQADWMETADVQALEPAVSSEIKGALWLPDDTQVSAPHLSRAFAAAAARLGASLVERCAVTNFRMNGSHIEAVQTSKGEFSGEQYIIAGGAWSGELTKLLDAPLPVFPLKGEAFSVLAVPQPIARTVYSHGCYIVPKEGNRLLVGASVKDCGFDDRLSIGGLHQLMAKAVRILPDIAAYPLEQTWASLRPQTADGLPYLGRLASVSNVIVASGHFRNGILLSPATGKIVSGLLAGEAPGLDLSAFAPDRHRSIPAS
ncbi:glycine oxidase ThiO [Aneurinibacillus uraniidurans]|uniref:glycine oxidase ThiO n=1 Tax=Aneurinibacillus uraniidurans TaxID=2966586 RepID=UPI00234B2E73|nr:glycine oxidase ThiO [Aneurinibacillus sp. B1]WCN37135.1 glycine oxidase ThiO [Aneurinibacillus sp. B1]